MQTQRVHKTANSNQTYKKSKKHTKQNEMKKTRKQAND